MQPLYTGYINNNEEPLLYFSVNRPEVERLIIPSEWIEAGIASYGEFSNKFNYALMLTNGVRAEEFRSPTWIRGGSEGQLKNFNRLAFSAQLNYLPISNITLCLTGYYNQSGRGRTIDIDGTPYAVEAPLSLFSGYIRWDHENFTMIGLGSYGLLEETYEIYHLTELEQGIGQVIGKEVYGFYMELGYDILPMFSNSKSKNARPGHFFTINNPTLPLFLRLERLDTHADIDQRLKDFSYFRNNLLIWILGCNYQPNHNLVVKFDVRFRDNLSASPDQPAEETLYEFGIGIEF